MKEVIRILYFILFSCLILNAKDNSGKKLFTALPASETGIDFVNYITEDGNMFYYKYEYLYMGGGVSIGDINNDGLEDVYFSSTQGSNKLFLNLGNLKFKDVTRSAGVEGGPGIKTGVNMVDINNDGYLDIYVSKSGPGDASLRTKMLYINNGNGTFTDKAKDYGLDDKSYTSQSYFLDYDKDNDLDLFIVNHPINFNEAMYINASMVNGKIVVQEDTVVTYISDRLFRNDNGKFRDVTKTSGVTDHGFGLSAAVYDFNADGWPDIFVANDFNKPDYIYINNKNGTFTDRMEDYFHHNSLSSMGSDINDINNDGFEDVIVVDMAVEDPVRQKQLFSLNMNYDKFHLMVSSGQYFQYPRNVLQLNNGNGSFTDIAWMAGVAETDWSWSPLIADYDNDGFKDIYITNGLLRDITDWDYKAFVLDSIKNLMARGVSVSLAEWFKQIPQVKIRNYFFRNSGTLKFDNFTNQWSDEAPSFSNGAAYADLDNDGDLDLVVNNIADTAFVLRNNSNEISSLNYISFRLLRNKDSKSEAYGATVVLTDDSGMKQTQRFDPQRGFISTMSHNLHFGLGNKTSVVKAEVKFLSGKKVILNNIAANQLINVYEDDGLIGKETLITQPVFSLGSTKKFSYSHKENDFIDFKREPLMPYKCSRKGPYFAYGDVNGDKLEDVVIGGPTGQAARLMIRNADGSYLESRQDAFTADMKFEDSGLVLFDAEGDGDADLYVASGGGEYSSGNQLYQDRLYLNDGRGKFSSAKNSVPKEGFNGSFVISLDYDEDGDLDIFAGGGVLPGSFPNHDSCMLLQNNKGIFINVTSLVATEFSNTGIVNFAEWADIDGDSKNELVLAGEWMPVMIYKYSSGKFSLVDAKVNVSHHTGTKKNVSLSQLTGWWNCVRVKDIDRDGDMDMVLGNRGTNSKINASLDEPCTVYAKDFDNNKSYDAVLGFYKSNKCYPMYHRDMLIDQMPFMRKKFIRYRHYAGKTMDDIFTGDLRTNMQIFKTTEFSSGVLLNDGNNSFSFISFPQEAQMSLINDLIVDDFNNDGILDVLLCGNSSDSDVSTGNYDGQAISLLRGTGNGNFKAEPHSVFDKKITGEIRRMIYDGKNKSVILLKNNSAAQVLSIN